MSPSKMEREKKLTDLIAEEYVSGKGSPRPLADLMVEAGYQKPATVPAVREDQSPAVPIPSSGIEAIIGLISDRRRMALDAMTDDKMRDANIQQLANVVDILTKNHQLLTGKETEKRGLTIEVKTFGPDDPLLAALQDEQRRAITGEIIIDQDESNLGT